MKGFIAAISVLGLLITSVYAEGENITYFSCKVKELVEGVVKGKTVTVTVKFAIQDFYTSLALFLETKQKVK